MSSVIASLFTDKLIYEQVFVPQVEHTFKKFKPNEKIISQGEKNTFFCFIKSGSVRIVLNNKFVTNLPVHTVIATLSKNDIFGEFRLFNANAANADVLAIEESEVVMIDVKSFMKFLAADPELGYRVCLEMLSKLAERLHNSNETVMHLMKTAIEYQRQLHQ